MCVTYSPAILQHVYKCKKCGSQLIMDGCGNPSCENYPYRRPTKRAADWWESARLMSIFHNRSVSCSQAESTPAHPQVTQTVGRAQRRVVSRDEEWSVWL